MEGAVHVVDLGAGDTSMFVCEKSFKLYTYYILS